MNLAVVATCFAVIFVAELPDKTALASLVLGTRYRAWFVFAGVAARHPEAVGVHFGIGCDHLLESMLAAGAGVLGLDWRTPIAAARRRHRHAQRVLDRGLDV